MNASRQVFLAGFLLGLFAAAGLRADDALPLPFDDATPLPTASPMPASASSLPQAPPAAASSTQAKAPIPDEVIQALRLAGVTPEFGDGLKYSWGAQAVPETDILPLAAARLSELRYFKFDFSARLAAELGDAADYSGRVIRSYTPPVDPKGANFRELISAQYQNISRPYSALTVRVGGGEEDAFWIYSPAIRQTRRLTAANRADALPGAGFSPEDLLVWSGSTESAELITWYERRESLPFAELGETALAAKELGCRAVEPTSPQEALDPQILRVPAVFVSRDVRVLEVSAKDPYSLYGRQFIHVDKESGLPIYKVVFDRGGRLWKVAVGLYRGGREENAIVPVPVGQIVYDFLNKKSLALYFRNFSFCRDGASPEESAALDPSRL